MWAGNVRRSVEVECYTLRGGQCVGRRNVSRSVEVGCCTLRGEQCMGRQCEEVG